MRWLLFTCVWVLVFAMRSEAQVTRGITGSIQFVSEGIRVRPRLDLNLDSPILVRVASERDLGNGSIEYTIEYIGAREGLFDLRETLEGVDGTVLLAAALPPIPIEIVSHLEVDAPTDVFVTAEPGMELVGGYRWIVGIIVAAWALVPIVAWVRRPRPEIEIVEVEDSGPTLADQLQPLVEAAANRTLSTPERGRLELLLYGFWSETLGLDERDRAEAIQRLRRDAEAGAVLRSVEAWLHGRHEATVTPCEINLLLEPYRSSPARCVEPLA